MLRVKAVLAIGLIAATFGNLLLLSGCKSVPVAATALALSTAADYASTYRALDKCPNCREGNPILRPLIPHKRTHAAFQVSFNLGIFYVTLREKKRGAKYWYVIPWTHVTVRTLAAANNEYIARKADKERH